MATPFRLTRADQSSSAIGASAGAIPWQAILAGYRPIGPASCRWRRHAADWTSMTTLEQVEVGELEMIRGTRAVLSLLAGKWNVPVLYLLASGTRRYSEVLYEVGEISKKTLTQTLRGLQRDGLVIRHAYAEVPVRVEYSLSALGWSLTGPLMTLYEWAAVELDGVNDARAMAA
jgi:DNA-binding HxlR family transcriptional regulator